MAVSMISGWPFPSSRIALGVGLMLLILTNSGADRARGGFGYRFTSGQTFGYSIEIEVDWSKKIERFSGTPVFVVKTVDPQSGAQLFTVGKLTCASRLRGAEEDTERPTRTIWIGSLVKVRSSGSVGGREDYNDNQLPDFLTALVKLKELVFMDLPSSATGCRANKATRVFGCIRRVVAWLTQGSRRSREPRRPSSAARLLRGRSSRSTRNGAFRARNPPR